MMLIEGVEFFGLDFLVDCLENYGGHNFHLKSVIEDI